MLRNLFRQSFWAVFVPLLLAAGLFWMDELRGYRAELSLLVLPKTETAEGAAGNLAALGRGASFALAVYETDEQLENPLLGKTPAERKAIWKKAASIGLVKGSDVIRISALGSDEDKALGLSRAILTELVRTGSQYYNQKTDVDIRIVEEPVIIPSLTAWPRFVASILGTALFFTTLFFIIYSLIERLFPKRRRALPTGNGEYVISPDTFKPRVPAYWGREDQNYPTEAEPILTEESPIEEAPVRTESMTEDPEWSAAPVETEPVFETENTPMVSVEEETEALEPVDGPDEAYVEEANIPETIEDEVLPERYETEPMEPTYAGYVSHAAAPDNLPIVDASITPLQGAHARLLKADIDETAEAYAEQAETEAALSSTSDRPQTHEPTPDEYRRRLNELLSGKM